MSFSSASTVPSGRQRREGVVGGGEDREGAFALEGVDQVSSGQGSGGQGGEAAIGYSGVNNVLRGQDHAVDDMDRRHWR
jgi:hypothetical protein